MRVNELLNALDKLKEHCYEKELSPNTTKRYLTDCQQLIKYLQNHHIDTITRNDIYAYREYLSRERKLKATSINIKFISINLLLTLCDCPELKIKPKRIQKNLAITNALTMPEYRTLIRHAKEENDHGKMYLIFKTLASTGMRVSELQYLTLHSVKKGFITELENKGKIRSIPLPKKLCGELLEYCINVGIINDTSPVFLSIHGRPVCNRSIQKKMKKIGGKGRIPLDHLHPHALRHLFGRTYESTYHNLAELADILGHSNLNVTRIYSRSTLSEQRNKMNELEF